MPLDEHDPKLDGSDQPVNADHLNMVNAFNQSATHHAQPFNRYCVSAAVDKPGKPKPSWLQIVAAWDDYIGEAKLEDWQRLCRDLTLEGNFKTMQDCKNALEPVWVNLVDFLYTPEEVALFASEKDLSIYCFRTKKYFPRDEIKDIEGSPLEALLAYVLQKRPEKTSKSGSKKRAKGRRGKTPRNKA